MVDTWTPVFNLSNEDKINKKTLKSDKQIGDVISKIERKEQGDFVKRKLPKFVCDIFRKIITSLKEKISGKTTKIFNKEKETRGHFIKNPL